jgi:hypothetical protein
MATQDFSRWSGLLICLALGACKSTAPRDDSDHQLASAAASTDAPSCTGQQLSLCKYARSYELGAAIDLAVLHLQGKSSGASAAGSPAPAVVCAEVSYPGREPELMRQTAKRGTYMCLFDSQYSMNMALNRISTFVEDFITVDAEPGYSDAAWSAKQKTEGTKGHNLESPDLTRYLEETRQHVGRRAQSSEAGVRLENEFLEGFIKPMLDPRTGKPISIVLGVYMPPSDEGDPGAILRAYLGHEIFHSLYFHSEKMRGIVNSYIDALPEGEQGAMRRKLWQKGYAVINDDKTPPSAKQIYMFYNEVAAYLLESGACVDGAFMSYEDDESDEPKIIIPSHAPLVVAHAAKLRRKLLDASVITSDWARVWSPELASCQQ